MTLDAMIAGLAGGPAAVHRWVLRGYLDPAVPFPGEGNRHQWTPEDLLDARLVRAAVDLFGAGHLVHAFATEYRRTGRPSDGWLYTKDGCYVFHADQPAFALTVLRHLGAPLVVLPVPRPPDTDPTTSAPQNATGAAQ